LKWKKELESLLWKVRT